MKCAKVERYIIENNITEYRKLRSSRIKKHVFKCIDCKQAIKQMNAYAVELDKIKIVETVAPTTNELTSFMYESNISKPNQKNRKLITIFRAASILLILLTGAYYAEQKTYINNSLGSLESTYSKKNENSAFIAEYRECSNSSEKLFQNLLKTDDEFAALVEKLVEKNPTIRLTRYSKGSCQQAMFYDAIDDRKLRLEIITQLIENDLK